MLPWHEKRPRSGPTMYDENVDEVMGRKAESPNIPSQVHGYALKAIAEDVLNAVKMGSRDRLAAALDALCELCTSQYEGE